MYHTHNDLYGSIGNNSAPVHYHFMTDTLVLFCRFVCYLGAIRYRQQWNRIIFHFILLFGKQHLVSQRFCRPTNWERKKRSQPCPSVIDSWFTELFTQFSFFVLQMCMYVQCRILGSFRSITWCRNFWNVILLFTEWNQETVGDLQRQDNHPLTFVASTHARTVGSSSDHTRHGPITSDYTLEKSWSVVCAARNTHAAPTSNAT